MRNSDGVKGGRAGSAAGSGTGSAPATVARSETELRLAGCGPAVVEEASWGTVLSAIGKTPPPVLQTKMSQLQNGVASSRGHSVSL